LVDEQLSAGTHLRRWDGYDTDGESVSSGIYFYRLEAGGMHEVRSMTLLK